MGYIPRRPDPGTDWPPGHASTAPAIVVHALKANRKPIGFWPWPDEEEAVEEAEVPKRKKRKKGKP
jgi:hypothetical protein